MFLVCPENPPNPPNLGFVFGDVNGNFEKLYTDVERLNERAGPFEACLCVGRFF